MLFSESDHVKPTADNWGLILVGGHGEFRYHLNAEKYWFVIDGASSSQFDYELCIGRCDKLINIDGTVLDNMGRIMDYVPFSL